MWVFTHSRCLEFPFLALAMSSESLQFDAQSVLSVHSTGGRESHTPTLYGGPSQNAIGDGVASADGGKDPYLVDFTEGDMMNPLNWSMAKRWYLTFLGGMLVLNACVLLAPYIFEAGMYIAQNIIERCSFRHCAANRRAFWFRIGGWRAHGLYLRCWVRTHTSIVTHAVPNK